MKKFKVLIKKAPQMKYGGQSQYGLNTGPRNVYSEMPENPNENLNSTLKPVPRSKAKIEAEKNEVAYGDLQGDGKLRAMKIGGQPHSRGGTPLDVPEGTFIYSNTPKMRIGGPVLQQFGKSENDKKKYTPAELASQYDVNKYISILEDPTKQHHHPTAKLNLANYQKKLAMLALVQEQKKGFPQGIPEISKPLVNMMQQQSGQNSQQEEMSEAMYGGSYMYGGMHGNPGTYSDGYSGTYSNGSYFDYGGAYLPDYAMAYGGSSQRSRASKPNDETLLVEVFKMLKQGASPDAVYGQLIQAKIPKKKAENILGIAVQELQKEMQQQGGGASAQQQPMQQEQQANMVSQDQMMAAQQPPMGYGGSFIPTYGDSTLPQFSMGANYAMGGAYDNPGFRALPEEVQHKIMAKAMYGMGMEYGGDYIPTYADNAYLPMADFGLEATEEMTDDKKPHKVKKSEISAHEAQGYKRVGNTNVWRRESSRTDIQDPTIIKGTPGSPAIIKKGTSGQKYVPHENAWWRSLTPEQKAAHNAKVRKMIKTDPKYTGTPDEVIPAVPTTPDKKECKPGYTYNPTTDKCEKNIPESDEITYDEDPLVPGGGDGGKVNKIPYKRSNSLYSLGDLVPPRAYMPDLQTFDARLPIPTFYDPTREMAKASETAAMLAAQTGQYNPRNLAAMSNYLQSNLGSQQGDILSKYNNLNVGVANQSDAQRTAIMNDLLNKRSGARKQYRDELTVVKQQLDNAYRDAISKKEKKAIMQKMVDVKENLQNQMYPFFADYNTGALSLKPGMDAYGRIVGGGGSGQAGMTYEQKVAEAKRLKAEGIDPAVINNLLNNRAAASGKQSAGANPYAYMQMMASAQNAYPYDVSSLYD